MRFKNSFRGLTGRAAPAAVLIGLFGFAQAGMAQPAETDAAEIGVLPVRGNIYMLAGAEGNSTVQVGDDGVLLVDTMSAEMGAKMLPILRRLSAKPIRYVINTGIDSHYTGGNAVIAQAGSTIAGVNVLWAIEDVKVGAAIVAHEKLLTRMSSQEPAPPFENWPTSTFFTETKNIFFNGEPIQILHQPNARTDGDSIVFFRRSDVISTGGVFDPTRYPQFDAGSGGSLAGIIDALNRIIDIAIPTDRNEGGTLIVPGHGRLCDESEVLEYRDMLTIVRSSIQEMIKEGRSLQQIQKARPTLAFDPLYGEGSAWTAEQFVEAVYRELKAKRR